MKLFLYSAFILLLAPCNKPKQTADSTPAKEKVIIKFETSACFGRCPIYKMTIDGENKTTTFIGEKYTEKLGTYTRPLKDEELKTFVEAFSKAKFSSMENEYLGPITDFPIKVISYTSGEKTKTVKGRSQEPKELTDLEKMLNEYANTPEGWTKTSDSSNSQD
jgi:hypothetical protein